MIQLTFVISVTRVDAVGNICRLDHRFQWKSPPIFLRKWIGGTGLGCILSRYCIGRIQGAGLARAPMREGAHNRKQVLSTLFAGGY